MAIKVQKIVKISIIAFLFLVAAGFAFNWYLTNSLEVSLKRKLDIELSNATNGFYRFSYNRLSVGFFSGELSIKGLEIVPDSTVYEQWQRGDSLPDTYFDIYIEEIYFKGTNLTWMGNYKNLTFSLFELKSPKIKIIEPRLNSSVKSSLDEFENKESKTLYQTISPYIDMLFVKRINLKNANISYVVQDSVSPVVYALQDATFNAYNFRLNEDSYISGKLLYCDNFEFEANKAQQLLYSDQLVLNTENIRLSTIDSLIKIDGIRLHPKEEFVATKAEKIRGYLMADIKSVEIGGVFFRRENARSYLDAATFRIVSTDIAYQNIDDGQENDKDVAGRSKEQDNQPWSLYTVVSPILQHIFIKKIEIEKTKFNYSITQRGYTDTYLLDQFNFHADNFLVDSLSEKQKKFWYVDSFTLTGADISGQQQKNNLNINVGKLFLSTKEKRFNISDINIKPIVTKNISNDYLWGSIKEIDIKNLDYNKGVSAGELRIISPDIKYFKVANAKQETSSQKRYNVSQNVLGLLMPYTDFLSVKNIDLKDANIIYHNDNSEEDYSLHNLNFYATDFLINEQTIRNRKYLFSCTDIGLSIKDFDNYLPGKEYRLLVKNADISTLSGRMTLRDVKLIPQTDKWSKAPSTYFRVNASLIDITGFDNEAYIQDGDIEMKSLTITSPQIEIIKTKNTVEKHKQENVSYTKALPVFNNLIIDTITMIRVDVKHFDNASNDSLHAKLETLQLNKLGWSARNDLKIGELLFESPRINYITHNRNIPNQNSSESGNLLMPLVQNINVGKFTVEDGKFDLRQPDLRLKINMQSFDFSGMGWDFKNKKSFLDLSSVNIVEPFLDINKSFQEENSKPQKPFSSKDIYPMLSPYLNRLSVGEFNVIGADINYEHSLDELNSTHQAINTTNLSVDKLIIDTDSGKLDMEDLRFNTRDLYFPIAGGFYTIGIDNIDINKKNATMGLSGLHMLSTYPKMEFAHKHPKHKDWFDFAMDSIQLSGVDFPVYFSDNLVKAENLMAKNIVLQNLKNQKIEIEHNIMPLIYEQLHDLPFRLDIGFADISNFSVVYEELPKIGTHSGRILFNGMNGKIEGLTNIVSYPNQYMRLDVDGIFMDSAYFTARWDMPIDLDNDCFLLSAHVNRFDMRELNQIFTPLARVEVRNGVLTDFTFKTEASSKGAYGEMLFLYKGLNMNVFRNADNVKVHRLYTRLVNAIIKSNNLDDEKSKPIESNYYIVRDPYHSTFNYFWQILQPGIAESVGVSKNKQSFIKKTSKTFSKLKGIFKKKKKSVQPAIHEEEGVEK